MMSIWYYLVLFWYQRTHHNFAPYSSSDFFQSDFYFKIQKGKQSAQNDYIEDCNQSNYQQSGNNQKAI